MAHTYQGSTVRPGCCVVLLISGGPHDGDVWNGHREVEQGSQMIRRCGLGPLDETHDI